MSFSCLVLACINGGASHREGEECLRCGLCSQRTQCFSVCEAPLVKHFGFLSAESEAWAARDYPQSLTKSAATLYRFLQFYISFFPSDRTSRRGWMLREMFGSSFKRRPRSRPASEVLRDEEISLGSLAAAKGSRAPQNGLRGFPGLKKALKGSGLPQ